MVHGNIKARNVLLTRELDAAKLSTSGLAHLVGNGKRTGPCTAAADIAALGSCLWLVRNAACTTLCLPAAPRLSLQGLRPAGWLQHDRLVDSCGPHGCCIPTSILGACHAAGSDAGVIHVEVEDVELVAWA